MKLSHGKKIVALSALMAAACAVAMSHFAPTAHAEETKAATTQAATHSPALDPNAERLLKSACKYLADAKEFTFKSEEWQDVVLASGQKIQTTRVVTIEEKRSDRLHVEVSSPRRSFGLWVQNKTMTLLDRAGNFFGSVETPGSIDKTVDALEEHFGIEIPMADLLVSDPYASATAGAKTGDYLGKASVLGVSCHHLAFTGEVADWQVWIQTGAKPLIRKIIINRKTQTGSPQFTAILSDWDLQSPIADETFAFTAPDGAFKIEIKALEAAMKAAPATQPAK